MSAGNIYERDADKRIAELEKQLAEAQEQLKTAKRDGILEAFDFVELTTERKSLVEIAAMMSVKDSLIDYANSIEVSDEN